MSVTIGTGQTSLFSNAPPDADAVDAAAFAALVAQQPQQQPTRDGPNSGGDTAGQVNSFYQDLLGQDADPRAMADIQDAMASGQSLPQVEANLRSNLAHSDTAKAKINGFHQDVLGQNAGPAALAKI